MDKLQTLIKCLINHDYTITTSFDVIINLNTTPKSQLSIQLYSRYFTEDKKFLDEC